ncbi:hypothetical protein BJ875DRAFT_234190 [Amylocarpus encephaloides]|uniref:Uncharacterized protein n=1 Tax=Amylocarpus encephaloides TaxID=45428 RepID=A0A9P7YMH7_9HELO|nr:hypothetical protein BJ875DRAFT_234190 [Amylocarpus encephaloides]
MQGSAAAVGRNFQSTVLCRAFTMCVDKSLDAEGKPSWRPCSYGIHPDSRVATTHRRGTDRRVFCPLQYSTSVKTLGPAPPLSRPFVQIALQHMYMPGKNRAPSVLYCTVLYCTYLSPTLLYIVLFAPRDPFEQIASTVFSFLLSDVGNLLMIPGLAPSYNLRR